MNSYQVEIETKSNGHTVCICPTVHATTEAAAKKLAIQRANESGFYGPMKMKVFGGHPVENEALLPF
jgi:hypothetical protein